MKILIVCGGGVIYGKETVTLALVQGLRAKGHDVRCVTSTWGDAFAKQLDALSVPYTRVPLGFISKTLRWDALYMTAAQLLQVPKLWQGYRRYVKEFNPDFIVHTNFHHLLLLWPFLDSQKTLFHVHDYFEPKAFYRYLIRFLNLRLRAFIGVSGFMRDSVIQLGIPKTKVFSVLNGIDMNRAQISRGALSRAVTIGIVGQIGDWKGHGDLVEALRILKSWGVLFKCIIFGQGEPGYITSLKEKINRYGLDNQIHLLGYVKDKQQIFDQIDICVVTSRCQEGFGMVAAEAATFGIPVVAARRGGLPEIVRHDVTGYLVGTRSPHELAERLKRLIEDPDLRQGMGQAARRHASQYLTQDRMVQEMEELLHRL